MLDDLLNLQDLARRLRVSVSWLKAEADAGRIPHLKAGHQRLFHRETVEAVLAERARSGACSPHAGETR